MNVEEMPDYETAGKVPCTGNEGCVCDLCVASRADFDAWVKDTDARWAQAYAEGRVAHLHSVPCRSPLCPRHGSPLDTSLDVVRLGLAARP
jgi:hypothetical protein